MIVTTKELCNILNIKKESFKVIKNRGKLKQRLEEKGYCLKAEKKEGRSILYYIENISENINVLANKFTIDNFNVRNDNFPKYYIVTTENTDKEFPKTVEMRAKESNTYPSLVKSWDEKLENKNIIKDKGYLYFIQNIDFKEVKPISQNEFYSITRNRNILKGLPYYTTLNNKGVINDVIYNDKIKDCIAALNNIGEVVNKYYGIKYKIYISSKPDFKELKDCIKKACGYSAFKVKNYNLNKDNDLHKASIALYSKVVK